MGSDVKGELKGGNMFGAYMHCVLFICFRLERSQSLRGKACGAMSYMLE
jgi:hypothetical protein